MSVAGAFKRLFSTMILPSDAGDISPLHGQEELLLLERQDPHTLNIQIQVEYLL